MIMMTRQITAALVFLLRQHRAVSFSTPSPILPQIVCVGDALFDCIANDDARGFGVQKLMDSKKWSAFPGGAPANVATAACKLGTPTAFVGCLGNDDEGDALVKLLSDIGVDVSLVQRTDAKPTRQVMVTRSLDGDRAFGAFMDNRAADEFADCELDAAQLLRYDEEKRLLENAKWMVCSTLGLAFPRSAEAFQKCVERGLDKGVKLYVDVNWRPVFFKPESDWAVARETITRLVQKAEIVKMTDEEAEWLFGITAEEALDHPDRVHKLLPNASAVLVTAGEKGAAYSILEFSGRVAPFVVDVTETTGAGDAFTAGFLHSLLSIEEYGDVNKLGNSVDASHKIHGMVRFAAAVGALTCTKEGAIAAQPLLADVESFLDSTPAT